MPRIVMKFGGTSMAGIERIRNVAARVKREDEAGNEVLGECPATALMHVETVRDGGRNERPIPKRGQRDVGDAVRDRVGRVNRHCQSQPGFADSAGTSQGDQPHVVAREQTVDDRNLALSANQRVQRCRYLTRRRVAVRFRHLPGSRSSNVDIRRQQVRHSDTRQRDGWTNQLAIVAAVRCRETKFAVAARRDLASTSRMSSAPGTYDHRPSADSRKPIADSSYIP